MNLKVSCLAATVAGMTPVAVLASEPDARPNIEATGDTDKASDRMQAILKEQGLR